MEPAPDIVHLAHAIQQAVAPVFLLTGVGAILNVLSGRLSRVVDRFRALDKTEGEERAGHAAEIATLFRRSRWINWAISLCTLCALFICLVIATLFIETELGKDPSRMIAAFFITAMLTLTAALLCFLREIALATGNLSMRKQM